MAEKFSKYQMRSVDVGQYLLVGKKGTVRREIEVVDKWGDQLILRKVGAVPKAGVDQGLLIAEKDQVESGKLGDMDVLGQLSRAEHLAFVEEAKAEKLLDPRRTEDIKQVGAARLARHVDYRLLILGMRGSTVREVTFEGRESGLLIFRRDVPVSEEVEVAASRKERGHIVFTEGVVPIPEGLVKATTREPGITVWKPGPTVTRGLKLAAI